MGIDFFNLLQPPAKQRVPDIIQVIPASPGDTAPQGPTTADQAFQAILDKALGIKTQPYTVSGQNPGGSVPGLGGISPAAPAVTSNNLFDFFSEAGFIYVLGAVLVALAFVMLRGK